MVRRGELGMCSNDNTESWVMHARVGTTKLNISTYRNKLRAPARVGMGKLRIYG